MAGELSNQVYTPPAAPDYLGHAIELAKLIPNAGTEFQKAQILAAQNAQAQAQYKLLEQKAQAFKDLYPAFKAAQMAKLAAETANLPIRGDLLRAQAEYQRAHAASFGPPPAGTASPIASLAVPPPPGAPDKPVKPFQSTGVLALPPEAPAATAPTQNDVRLQMGAQPEMVPDPFASE